jgi:hypothetical protein
MFLKRPSVACEWREFPQVKQTLGQDCLPHFQWIRVDLRDSRVINEDENEPKQP